MHGEKPTQPTHTRAHTGASPEVPIRVRDATFHWMTEDKARDITSEAEKQQGAQTESGTAVRRLRSP